MARKGCFEVTKLEFNFYSTKDEVGRTKIVSDAMETYLRKYASGTNYEIVHEVHDLLGSDVQVIVEFSKSISLNTVNKILSRMDIRHIDQMLYKPFSMKVVISVDRKSVV